MATKVKKLSALFGPMLLCAVAMLTLLPVFDANFWPLNHEYDTFFKRTLIYSNHFSQLDFIPLWAASDNYGLGSPLPILYHKLFYYFSGIFHLITDDFKLSIVLTLNLFLISGGLGVYFLCREVGCSEYTSWVGATSFAVSNYTLTNWLIRGAMAEFAAAMLVPIALTFYIKFLQKQKRSYKLCFSFGLIVALIFVAHSVLAFYIVILMSISTLYLILISRIELNYELIRSTVVASLGFLIIAAPVIFFMSIMGLSFDMERIIPEQYHPINQFKQLQLYFFDNEWQWGATWQSYTVQVDLVAFVVIAVALVRVFSRAILRKGLNKTEISFSSSNVLVLIILLVMCAFLQTTLSAWFYLYFPGAKYIQFPWRLLAIITPISIVLALACISNLKNSKNFIVFSFGVLSIAVSGIWAPITYGELGTGIDLKNVRFSAFGEYVPIGALDSVQAKESILRDQNGCDLRLVDAEDPEQLSTVYLVECNESRLIALPHYDSGWHLINVYDKNNLIVTSKTRCNSIDRYPGLCAITIKQGKYLVELRHPTVGRVLYLILEKLWR